MRFAETWSGSNPFTNSKSAPQLNLHIGEILYFTPVQLGLTIEQSYLLVQLVLSFVSISVICFFGAKILRNRFWAIFFTVFVTFVVFPETFLRPVSPAFHGAFLLLFLYFAWRSLAETKKAHVRIAFILGLFLGLGYPYFALWASALGATILTLTHFYETGVSRKRVLSVFGGLWLMFILNLVWVKYFGDKLETHATTYLHFPTGYARITVSFLVITVFVWKADIKSNFNHKFVLSALISSPIILLSPIVTGEELEFNSHITFPYSIWIFLAVFVLVQIVVKRSTALMFLLTSFMGVLLLWSEYGQMPLLDRPNAVFKARLMLDRTNSGELKEVTSYIDKVRASDTKVLSIPQDLVNILYIDSDWKLLSHPYAGFNHVGVSEWSERFLVNDFAQGLETSFDFQNRALYGTRGINQCNRIKNYAKILEVINLRIDTKTPCSVPMGRLQELEKLQDSITKTPQPFLNRYGVTHIVIRKELAYKISGIQKTKVFENGSFVVFELPKAP